MARIRTDSRGPGEPKDPDGCLVFALFRQFASEAERESMRDRYVAGDIAYAAAKTSLTGAIERELGPARARFHELRSDDGRLRAVLGAGADRARALASTTLARLRHAIGSAA
jgi:tryptophanyl-tRNA synthetase